MKKAKRMQLVNALAEAKAQSEVVWGQIDRAIELMREDPTKNIYKSGLVDLHKELTYLKIDINKIEKKLKIK